MPVNVTKNMDYSGENFSLNKWEIFSYECFIHALIESQIFIGHMLYTSTMRVRQMSEAVNGRKKTSNSHKPTKSLASLN